MFLLKNPASKPPFAEFFEVDLSCQKLDSKAELKTTLSTNNQIRSTFSTPSSSLVPVSRLWMVEGCLFFFLDNVGVGEREARVFSDLVSKRNFRLGHRIGRSGTHHRLTFNNSVIFVNFQGKFAKSVVGGLTHFANIADKNHHFAP